MENTKRINFYGFLGLETGLGEAARNNIEALRKAGLTVSAFDISAIGTGQPFEKGINIIQVNPDNLDALLINHADQILTNSYNIGFWAWETEDFPDEYCKYFNYFDEIWTPSSYCQNVISKKSPIPVLNIPHTVPIIPSNDRQENLRQQVLGNRRDTFVFSFFFDYKSQVVRKNVIGLIKSFRQAFGTNAPQVTLLLKTYPSSHHLAEKAIIEKDIGDDSSILLFEKSLERSDLQDLLRITNCYVSLHHAEGFGLTMAEAMAVGTPVIATAYSGNMEYMNINNALLVKYKMTTLIDAVGPFTVGSIWADPSQAHAAVLMKEVYEGNVNGLKELIDTAKKQILDNHNHCRIGKLMVDRIRIIEHKVQSQHKVNNQQEILRLRIENDLLNTKLNKIRDIGYVKLKLKFKNLKNRITGKNRKYIWE